MFRLAIISFIALRVIACPAFCAVGAGDMSLAGVKKIGCCHCVSDQSAPCGGNESSPGSTPCQHDSGCTLQVTSDSIHRSVVAEVALSLDFIPLCLDTPDLSSALAKRYDERCFSRHDLLSGRDVRLAYASRLF